jgi:hypothetical protein
MSKKSLQTAHEEIANLLNLIKCKQDMELDLNKVTDNIIQAVIAATTSADNVLAELTVDARKRTLYNDSVDGFKARRAAYRSRFEKLYCKKPIVGSDNDYRVTDFLAEEWGDLIANKMLKPTVLAARDYRLYRALVEHVRSVRRGRHDRVPDESISVTDLLTEPKKSVREMLDVYEYRHPKEQVPRSAINLGRLY